MIQIIEETPNVFWLGLQMDYDLDVAEDTLSSRIHKEVHPLAVA